MFIESFWSQHLYSLWLFSLCFAPHSPILPFPLRNRVEWSHLTKDYSISSISSTMYCTIQSSCSVLATNPNCWSQYSSMKYALLLAMTVFIISIITPLPIVADDNTNLKILVPLKLGFQEYLQWQSSEIPITPTSSVNFSGFAIDVFQACINKLSYKVNYTLLGYGDGVTNPSYQDLVDKLVSQVLLMINFHLNLHSHKWYLVIIGPNVMNQWISLFSMLHITRLCVGCTETCACMHE